MIGVSCFGCFLCCNVCTCRFKECRRAHESINQFCLGTTVAMCLWCCSSTLPHSFAQLPPPLFASTHGAMLGHFSRTPNNDTTGSLVSTCHHTTMHGVTSPLKIAGPLQDNLTYADIRRHDGPWRQWVCCSERT